jgi:hypothetical protein
VPLIWFAVPPVDNRTQPPGINQQIKEFNQKIKELCAHKKTAVSLIYQIDSAMKTVISNLNFIRRRY